MVAAGSVGYSWAASPPAPHGVMGGLAPLCQSLVGFGVLRHVRGQQCTTSSWYSSFHLQTVSLTSRGSPHPPQLP